MALILSDRVQETSTSTGTGTISLAGAVTGYQSFAVVGNTNTTYYTIADQSGSNWEVGIGTYYSGNTSLARTTILASSNANAAVVFTAGTKSVFVTYPAEKAIYSDAGNVTTITNLASANVLLTGGTISGITIPAANVSGLGTMATQNAVSVTITGGTINSTTQNASTYNNVTLTSGTINSTALTGGSIDNMTIGSTTPNSAVVTSITATGNVTANGVSKQFVADFSNATVASRFTFTASAANANPGIYAVPSGVGTAASWQAANSSSITNASKILIASNGTSDVQLVSGINGTGSYLPLGFWNSGAERMRLDTSGNLLIGTTTALAQLNVAGAANTTALNTPNIVEPTTVSGTGAASTINFDVNTQSVYYSTANATANWTVNFRGSSTFTLANTLANNQTITCSLLATQGATAYYNSLVQIDGSTVTPKWQGGTAPTSGDTAAVDVYNYVITKTSTAPTYTVLASVTKFA